MVLGICGKSGSGKDTLIKMIKDRNKEIYRMVKASDRPPRKYEKNGQAFKCFAADQHALQHGGSKRIGHRQ